VTTFCCSMPPATTAFSTLSLHDALPIFAPYGVEQVQHVLVEHFPGADLLLDHVEAGLLEVHLGSGGRRDGVDSSIGRRPARRARSEEHTSELQSRENLVCRLLLEKKKTK